MFNSFSFQRTARPLLPLLHMHSSSSSLLFLITLFSLSSSINSPAKPLPLWLPSSLSLFFFVASQSVTQPFLCPPLSFFPPSSGNRKSFLKNVLKTTWNCTSLRMHRGCVWTPGECESSVGFLSAPRDVAVNSERRFNDTNVMRTPTSGSPRCCVCSRGLPKACARTRPFDPSDLIS